MRLPVSGAVFSITANYQLCAINRNLSHDSKLRFIVVSLPNGLVETLNFKTK